MTGTLRSWLSGALCLITTFVTLATPLDDLEDSAQIILEPVQIADATIQLDTENKHLLGIEDTRFVSVIMDCSNVIADNVDIWKEKYGITTRRQEIKDSRVYVEIETLEPVHGSLIVIYRFLSADKKAYLKFLFDSNARIDPTQQEQVAARYRLVELKRTLVESMKCG